MTYTSIALAKPRSNVALETTIRTFTNEATQDGKLQIHPDDFARSLAKLVNDSFTISRRLLADMARMLNVELGKLNTALTSAHILVEPVTHPAR